MPMYLRRRTRGSPSTMKDAALAVGALLLVTTLAAAQASECESVLQGMYDVKYMEWSDIQPCLAGASGGSISRNASETVWRLTKTAFGGVEHIPAEVYGQLGLVLPAIGVEELRNISMEQVETVEAFGSIWTIGTGEHQQGFSADQMTLIAQKVRAEWLGKSPSALSEYDLQSLGEIVCHFNVSDITGIHADAFKAAAEWIGNIENCPKDQLQAFAKLAVTVDAFGAPQNWSKLEVSIVGNILNGLSSGDIATIHTYKLHLNRFYTQTNVSKHRR